MSKWIAPEERAREDTFDITGIIGLSEQEAAERLKATGYNELPSARHRGPLAIALGVVREPMFTLLLGAGVVYLALGDLGEALMLLGSVFLIMGISIYQEGRTERALEALRDLSSPRALVIRGGEAQRIPGREVVPGDIVILAEGDRVPADGVVISTSHLSVDESLLTGESVPVRKRPWNGAEMIGRPGGDDRPFVYSGTLVVQGQGVEKVEATGAATEIGKIGKSLRALQPQATPLQQQTGRLVRILGVLGITLSVLVAVLYAVLRGHILNGILAGIALGMSMLPEELPVVFTVFLALGAWRMAQQRVLTRRLPTLETLGAATVLCVDKTGTLTLNQMSVRKIAAPGTIFEVSGAGTTELPTELRRIIDVAVLASQREPFDPMEKALLRLGEEAGGLAANHYAGWTLVREYPLSPDLPAMSNAWKAPSNSEYIVAAKGAPEAIADLCHLTEEDRRVVLQQTAELADEGLRVLGVAQTDFQHANLPDRQRSFDFTFLGLVGLADPVRPSVPASIQEAYQAGIRVVMITGDYPRTAQSIARQIGLAAPDASITGSELTQLGDAELRERVRMVNIFARVVPEQKLRLVKTLQADGQIVAMTGDGVNDAPALKAANIGIAMGGRGTDVAREASDLVLLDDDFSSIVRAVRAGRRIFDNLKKAAGYILAVHVPIAGMSLLPVLFGWPLVLLPVHIVFLELIIDPASSLVFEAEPEEANVMKRPPRRVTEPLLSVTASGLSIIQGFSVFLVVLAVFLVVLYRGESAGEIRALAFSTLIAANLTLILTNRSWTRTIVSMLRSPNAALWWVVGGAVILLILVLSIPTLRHLFNFGVLHLDDIALAVGAGTASLMWFEALKVVRWHT